MATDTKTYKVVVDTSVTGEESVEKLGTTVENTTNDFTRLQLQIRKTKTEMQAAEEAGDQITFNKLKKQLDELDDKLEVTTKKSMQWDDQLQAMPGTLGNVGNGVKSVDGAFKMLKANPLLAILGVVAGLFMGVYEALKSTKEGNEALNKVTTAFGQILTPIITFISNLAIPIIEGLAGGIQWLAKTFGLVKPGADAAASAVEGTSKAYLEAANSIEKLYKEQERLSNLRKASNLSKEEQKEFETLRHRILETNIWLDEFRKQRQIMIQESRNDQMVMMRDFLKGTQFMNDQEIERYKVQQEYQIKKDELIKSGILKGELLLGNEKSTLELLEIEKNKKLLEIDKKYSEERKRKTEEENQKRLQKQKEYNDKQLAAQNLVDESRLNLMDEKSEELGRREKKFNNDLNVLRAAGWKESYQGWKTIVEEYNKDVLDINKKYDDQSKAAFQKLIDDELDYEDYFWEEYDRIRQEGYNKKLDDIDVQMSLMSTSYDDQIKLSQDKENLLLQQADLTEAQKTSIMEQGLKERSEIRSKEISLEAEKWSQISSLVSSFGQSMYDISELIGTKQTKAKKALAISGIIIEKAGAIGKIIADTAAANAAATAAFPLTLGQPWVGINTATAVASGLAVGVQATKSIQEITSSDSSSGGGSSSISLPTAASISTPQVQSGGSSSIGTQIASTLAQTQQPQKTYVVSQDMTSQQQLQRRVYKSATF